MGVVFSDIRDCTATTPRDLPPTAGAALSRPSVHATLLASGSWLLALAWALVRSLGKAPEFLVLAGPAGPASVLSFEAMATFLFVSQSLQAQAP